MKKINLDTFNEDFKYFFEVFLLDECLKMTVEILKRPLSKPLPKLTDRLETFFINNYSLHLTLSELESIEKSFLADYAQFRLDCNTPERYDVPTFPLTIGTLKTLNYL